MADIAGAAQTESSRVIPLVRVLITDTGSGRNLMNSSVDISSLAGHEGLPFITPTARWILPNSAVNVQFTSYDAAATYGNVAGANDTFNLQIEADAYFVITKLSYMADIAGAAQTESSRVIPLVRVLITDTGSGRNLMNSSVDISSLAGHEGLPFITPTARWILPNSAVNVQFTSYDAAATYGNVSLYFHGKKIWF